MKTDLASVESAIAAHRIKLDEWLDNIYEQGATERQYVGELDACYECWRDIESTVGTIFNTQLTQSLSPLSLDSVLFFASRNEECGRIIAWLGLIGPFSNVGELSLPDFLFLCDSALAGPEDFVDYQLVNCFHKLPSLNPQHVNTIIKFFARNEVYTKRLAIGVLASKGFQDLPQLAQQLWVYDDCESTKLSVLHALKQTSLASSLLAEYLAEFKSTYDVDAHDYLQSHIQRLES